MNAKNRRTRRRLLRQHLPGLVARIATARIVRFAPASVINSWAWAVKHPNFGFHRFESIHREISAFEKEDARYL